MYVFGIGLCRLDTLIDRLFTLPTASPMSSSGILRASDGLPPFCVTASFVRTLLCHSLVCTHPFVSQPRLYAPLLGVVFSHFFFDFLPAEGCRDVTDTV